MLDSSRHLKRYSIQFMPGISHFLTLFKSKMNTSEKLPFPATSLQRQHRCSWIGKLGTACAIMFLLLLTVFYVESETILDKVRDTKEKSMVQNSHYYKPKGRYACLQQHGGQQSWRHPKEPCNICHCNAWGGVSCTKMLCDIRPFYKNR